MKNIAEKCTALWQKYRIAMLILLLGLFLMLLPGEKKQETVEMAEQQQTFSLEATEEKMEKILGKIEGAGKLKVMLTLKNGPQLQLAEDVEGAHGSGEMESRRETVTLKRGSSYEDVVVTRQTYPTYQGAVVVCQGADKAAVKLAVTEAVASLTGLSSDRITVVKWSS